MDDLSDADLGDSDEETGRGVRDGFEGADFVKRAHFGGGADDDDGVDGGGRRLSAKELLEETIAKYKLAKYERQEKKREENDQITALDEEFDAIRGLVFQTGSKAAAKAKGIDLATGGGTKSSLAAARLDGGEGASAHGDFEKLAAELSRDMKAAPTERLQTEEELATAEAQRLRMLEAQRQQRMQPDAPDAADADGGRGRTRGPTDDDLLDDFGPLPGDLPMDDMEENSSAMGSDDDDDNGGEEEEEEDGEEDEDSDSEAAGADENASSDEEGEEGEEDEDEEGGEVSETSGIKQVTGRKMRSEAAAGSKAATSAAGAIVSDPASLPELPYVYACPTSAKGLDELMTLAGPYVARQRELLHRLIAGHHTRLKEANKEKLATLAGLLLDRMLKLADKRGSGAFMQPLCPSLFTIAQQLPVQVALVILPKLQAARAAWRADKQERRAGGAPADDDEEGAKVSGRHASLPPSTLALVALCCQLYSLSDFRHVVLTPLALFVQEVLAQREAPATETDLRRTLFLCSCAVHLVAGGGQWMPELHAAAHTLYAQLIAHGVQVSGEDEPVVDSLRFEQLLDGDTDDARGEISPMACDSAAAILRLLTDLASVSAALPAFIELFAPTLKLLESDEADELPGVLQPAREACLTVAQHAAQRRGHARAPAHAARGGGGDQAVQPGLR